MVATETHQRLFSHARHGDNNYNNKMECEWVIMASHGNHVKFNFDTFEIEDESDCGSVMSLNFNSIFCIRKKTMKILKQIIYISLKIGSNHFP